MQTSALPGNGKESVGGNLGGQESRGAPVTGEGVLGRGGLRLQTRSPMASPAQSPFPIKSSRRVEALGGNGHCTG